MVLRSGVNVRLSLTSSILRTGMSCAISGQSAGQGLFSCMQLTPSGTSAGTAVSRISSPSADGEVTFTLISPGTSLAAIIASSFPENSLRDVHLYCSKSAESPLSRPMSLPAPVTSTFTRSEAFATNSLSSSYAEISTNIRSRPSAFIFSLSGIPMIW